MDWLWPNVSQHSQMCGQSSKHSEVFKIIWMKENNRLLLNFMNCTYCTHTRAHTNIRADIHIHAHSTHKCTVMKNTCRIPNPSLCTRPGATHWTEASTLQPSHRWAVPLLSGHDLPAFEGLKLLLQSCDRFTMRIQIMSQILISILI